MNSAAAATLPTMLAPFASAAAPSGIGSAAAPSGIGSAAALSGILDEDRSTAKLAAILRVVSHRAVRPTELGARPYVVYRVTVLGGVAPSGQIPQGAQGEGGGAWSVERRFSQFEQLLQELRAQVRA